VPLWVTSFHWQADGDHMFLLWAQKKPLGPTTRLRHLVDLLYFGRPPCPGVNKHLSHGPEGILENICFTFFFLFTSGDLNRKENILYPTHFIRATKMENAFIAFPNIPKLLVMGYVSVSIFRFLALFSLRFLFIK
jgi:hypothetical protein